MCALFGWYKPEFPAGTKRGTLFRHLARKAQIRGQKGIGLASPGMKIIKYTGPAHEWIARQKKAGMDKLVKVDILLGHTRQPTKGAVGISNQHPFEIGNWVAAHNGTISNSEDLLEQAAFVAKGNTDSEEALCFLAGHDFSTTSFDELEGSFAIVAMKKDGSELVIAVDDGKDFAICRLGDGLVWHTSETALESSLIAAGIKDPDVRSISSTIVRLPGMKTVKLKQKKVISTGWEKHNLGGNVFRPQASNLGIQNEEDLNLLLEEQDAEDRLRHGLN